MGQHYLGLFNIPTEKYRVPFAVIYLLALYAAFMFLLSLALECKRFEPPESVTMDKKLGTEHSYFIAEIPKIEKTFTSVTLAFMDLWCTVPLSRNPKHDTIDLLKGITGYALPGTMAALMGSSGAGKTTLMDVSAGCKTDGKIQGQILQNGCEGNDLAIRRSTSALSRQDSSVPDSKKFDSVNECLDLLDMQAIADQITRCSSVEQMKCLTIGVELAAQPNVLFLDEPTSDLDARSAKLIINGVCKVASTGRTIVCTIRQPSSRHCSDYLWLQPAASMLECIGAGVGSTSADAPDFVQVFNRSENKKMLEKTMAKPDVCTPSPGVQELTFTQKCAASSAVQMKHLVSRFVDMRWRTPSYNLTRFVMSIILALLFGLVFTDANCDSCQGMNSGIPIVCTAILFSGMMSFNSVLPIASAERESLYRERASQTYNAFYGILFTVIFYPMAGFTGFSTAVLF
ncbi:Atp-binding protein, partial [Globisporangium splendens]